MEWLINAIGIYKLKKSAAAVRFHEKGEAKGPEEFKTFHETQQSKVKVEGQKPDVEKGRNRTTAQATILNQV